MKEISKSKKLNNVAYDVRGPVLDAANAMEAAGAKILKLNIGNPGILPKWRGVAGNGWLFIDEIEVYGHEK